MYLVHEKKNSSDFLVVEHLNSIRFDIEQQPSTQTYPAGVDTRSIIRISLVQKLFVCSWSTPTVTLIASATPAALPIISRIEFKTKRFP